MDKISFILLLILAISQIAWAARAPILNAVGRQRRRPRVSQGGVMQRGDDLLAQTTPTPTIVPLPYMPTTFDSAVCAAYPEICYNAGLLPTGKKHQRK